MRGSLWEDARAAKGVAAERRLLTRARLRAADTGRTAQAREDAAAAVELLEEREAMRRRDNWCIVIGDVLVEMFVWLIGGLLRLLRVLLD